MGLAFCWAEVEDWGEVYGELGICGFMTHSSTASRFKPFKTFSMKSVQNWGPISQYHHQNKTESVKPPTRGCQLLWFSFFASTSSTFRGPLPFFTYFHHFHLLKMDTPCANLAPPTLHFHVPSQHDAGVLPHPWCSTRRCL